MTLLSPGSPRSKNLRMDLLQLLQQSVHEKSHGAADQNSSMIRHEALLAWEQLLQHYRQEPSSRWQPLPATLGKVLLLHKDDPRASLEILTDAILFVKDYPECQVMVDGPVLRLVLLTLVKHNLPEDAERMGRYMMEAYDQGAVLDQNFFINH